MNSMLRPTAIRISGHQVDIRRFQETDGADDDAWRRIESGEQRLDGGIVERVPFMCRSRRRAAHLEVGGGVLDAVRRSIAVEMTPTGPRHQLLTALREY